ncbi:gamma-glutamyltransferase [Pseudotabrizicola alkalilacus]|uniref:gamma-glutamyltransferase n=1 Tax=Pseudotabrizicola alkalilacus TaxID=2305252 RepID=UPI0018F1D774|nr:gamma-glutamyltransferase [Pseudotabrizicola alkalilacus]
MRSSRGIVSAQNRHAAEAGAAILEQGGNAVDAAVVTTLVLSVVEPWLSGIGGGGFMLRADGVTGEVNALDFGVIAPLDLNPDDYPIVGENDGDWFSWPEVQDNRNISGPHSICTPGTIAGLAEALERHGTLNWADALAPAIEWAERGLELDWFACFAIANEEAGLSRCPATANLFLPGGRVPRAGDSAAPRHAPMPQKARLLRRLAQAGARDFYEGEIAAKIASDLSGSGSALSAKDLAEYRPDWVESLAQPHAGWDIRAMPGLSGGPGFLDALNRLQALRPAGRAAPSGASAAAFASAIRDAYRERLGRAGHAGHPDADCTSHVSVVDASGTMVSLTNTLLSRFGSRVVGENTGFLFNNGVMWFDPRPGQPNSIAPGVKPLANMCPLILLRDGRPALAIGAAGGRQIFPALLQLVSFVTDYGMTLEEAFHYPRIDASSPTILVDSRDGMDVASTIARDWPVRIIDNTLYPVNFAIPSAVMCTAPGEFSGQAHPYQPWAYAAAAREDAG